MAIKYYLKIIFILFFTTQIYSQTVSSVQQKIDALLSEDFFQSTLIGIDVYNLTSKEMVYHKNEKILLHPASNMKILTSTAGLLFLGPKYEFKTSVYYTGEIINETLYGDLYVIGGLDPDFSSDNLDSMIIQIKLAGIKEVSGNIYGDVSVKDSIFWGNGWMWDDDPSTDAPYLSALNINDNAVAIIVKGTTTGNKSEIISLPKTDYIQIINETITVPHGEENTFNVDRDWLHRKNSIIAKGKVEEGTGKDFIEKKTRLNILEPEKYFMTLFEEGLNKEGIRFNPSNAGEIKFEVAPQIAKQLFTFSRSFDSIIVNLNKTSDNLSAEMTLYALAAKNFGKPATAINGVKMIDSLISLTGLDPDDYRLVDGSGVSHYNLITAELLLQILKYIYYSKPELYDILYNSFPIGGVDGTLSNRMKDTKAENNVHAKTGTLSGISSLSGYLKAANGDLLAFSILVQNYVRGSSKARNYIDEICKILAED